MPAPDRSPEQDKEERTHASHPLPDVPDAGDESEPLTSATPPNVTNEMLTVDGAITAGTLAQDDDRTLYEKTLEAQEESEQNADDRPA